MIRINVNVGSKSWSKKIKITKNYFNKRLLIIKRNVKFFKKKNINFTILLTNSSNMKKLNKKFRKINKETDVLSFPNFNLKEIEDKKKNPLYLGDIAVCYEIINKRSKISNFASEFDKVWVHGLLHLAGYNHIKTKDYIKMEKIEKKILNIIKK
jgi:probable rRNA maturation factor